MLDKNNLINNSTLRLIQKRIRNELIPWCQQNNKKIYDIKSRNEDGKHNNLYLFLLRIKKNVQILTEDDISLLNSYGMVWDNNLEIRNFQHSATARIYNELIPWCIKNNKRIYEVPRRDENHNINPLYNFVYNLRRNYKYLSEATIALLNEYGIIWNKMKNTKKRTVLDEPVKQREPYKKENSPKI